MRILVRFILALAAIIGVLVMILGGIALGTGGNLGFLADTGLLPNLGSLRSTPGITSTVQGPANLATGTLRFTWRGDEIIYNEAPLSEADFATMLVDAEANGTKVEIVKFSDVRVEAADRWREMLDEAGVRYEVIPQE